jgi:hypothetical protein
VADAHFSGNSAKKLASADKKIAILAKKLAEL